MSDGWIKLHRKILESGFWEGETFSRGQAWIDLLLLTNWKPKVIRKRGLRVYLDRGDCGWSEIALAERWRWSRGKVRRFLDELESEKMITKKRYKQTDGIQDKRTNKITIVNYEKYQNLECDDGTSNGTTDDTISSTIDGTIDGTGIKKEKKEKKKPRGKIDAPDFVAEEVWNAFVEHRKQIKAPLTDYAAKLIFNKLEKAKNKGFDPEEMLKRSIESGWKGVFEPSGNNAGNKNQNRVRLPI